MDTKIEDIIIFAGPNTMTAHNQDRYNRFLASRFHYPGLFPTGIRKDAGHD